jgi:serine/threonine protein kinase/Tfp pilus assembly protein PilF
MILAEKEITRCDLCGTNLTSIAADSGCLNCLLRAGFEEGPNEPGAARRFQHYELCLREDGTRHELGHGAMGITYLALDANLGSQVALKIISARFARDAEARERFRREARAAAQLRHPNVASVFHFGETPAGDCFYAMEFIDGETLETRVRRDGPLPTAPALEIATQVARALLAAESHTLVHRDLKPSNLMVLANDPGGADSLVVKVIDFGLAKAVAALQSASDPHAGFSGTPDFASPEQFNAAKVLLDARSDIYSLGVTLWYLLCGCTPFAGRVLGEAHDHTLPLEQLTKVPPQVIALLRSMLAVNPADRPQSARELLAALHRCRESLVAAPRRRRMLKLTALALGLLIVSTVALTKYFSHPQPAATAIAAPEKSIAVLPFENLSEEKANAFFTEGVQDEILTHLARMADLKVISRTSVMQYKSGAPRNLREIGQQLGVAHVVEGSVQRAANKVRVNAELVDARTDAHLWAQTYDRDLADVFAIQSEIAKAIADQLQAKLSPNEKKAIEQPPTTDLAAFDLYSRAKSLLLAASFSITGEPDLRKAIELLDEAVKRDPSFFDAYCQLAYAHEQLYAIGAFDHTPARLALAEAAVQAATRLRPDAAETHLARAQYLYYGLRDYAGTLAELEIARRGLPNDPRLFELTGYILRRRGQQEEGLRNLERAVELDPRNLFTLQQIAISYQLLGRYAEAIGAVDRALAIVPDNVETRASHGLFYLCWKADSQPLHQTIDAILAQGPGAIASAADGWFFCALAERDPVAAERALVALGDNPCWREPTIYLSRSFGEGLLARMTKDEARARTAFEAARAQQEKIVQTQPDYGPALCVLGLIDAALGRKDLALDEGRRAIALTPLEKDVINGSRVLQYFAITAAWAGDKELALQQLKDWLRAPYASVALSYGALKLHPLWDPLRGDPRFEKIVESLAPKEPPK